MRLAASKDLPGFCREHPKQAFLALHIPSQSAFLRSHAINARKPITQRFLMLYNIEFTSLLQSNYYISIWKRFQVPSLCKLRDRYPTINFRPVERYEARLSQEPPLKRYCDFSP